MSTETWGEMPKAQDDGQKIEERIAELIAAHEADPEAHLSETGSLQSHKASEIIDHLAESIVDDKVKSGELGQSRLSSTEIQLYTAFESLDGWLSSGSEIAAGLLGAKIRTSSVLNNEAFFVAEAYGFDPVLNLDKKSSFTLALSFDFDTSQTVRIGHHNQSFDDTTVGYGFKVVNGQLYCVVYYSDGASFLEEATAVSGFVKHQTLVFRAELDPDTGEISFYLNGSLLHVSSRDVSGLTDVQFFSLTVHNDAASARAIYPRSLLFSRVY